MFQWAQDTFDKLSQTVAPPPTDGPGRFAYSVQRGEEDTAMGCIAEIDPIHTIVNQAKGQYPIHMACQFSQQRLIQLLMNQPGINIAQPDMVGNTPLHYAAMSTAPNGLDVVKLLISTYGASVIVKNSQGQTPYDVATMNSIRQYLLPIQLQAETQIALDNGGKGLPPGIDMGGLRIKNPAMPPPPTFGGGPAATPGTPAAPSGAQPAPIPAPHMFGTPSPSHPSTQRDDRIVSAPASAAALGTSSAGYSRVGSSSAALSTASKYRADGFHSSSSDVSLQKKYGHSSVSSYGSVAPPPSSGNSIGPVGMPVPAATPGGANPFAAGSLGGGRYGGMPSRRYVNYGQVAEAPAPVSGPAYSNYAAPQSGNMGVFNPGGSAVAAVSPQAAPAQTSPYASNPSMVAPQNTASTPTTPYMPPPPYQSHNYTNTVDAVAAQAPSPMASTTSPLVAQNSANMAEAQASDIFAAPSPEKEAPEETTAAASETDAANANEAVAGLDTAEATGAEGATTLGDALPQNWVETVDPSSGKTYYYNSVTHETSWEKPSAAPANDPTALPENWTQLVDPNSGHPYYYNSVTQETSWERPVSTPVVQEPLQSVAEPASAAEPATDPVVSDQPSSSQPAGDMSATDAFAAPAPVDSAPSSAASATFEAPAVAPVETPAPAAALNTFGAPAQSDSTGTSAAANAFAAPAQTSHAFSSPPADASDVFGAPAAEASGVDQVAVETKPSVDQPKRELSADDLFAAAAPVDNQGAAVNGDSTAADQTGDKSTDLAAVQSNDEGDGDGVMDDVPLSPWVGPAKTAANDLSQTTDSAAIVGDSDANSLFASIGMPPPPFSKKR